MWIVLALAVFVFSDAAQWTMDLAFHPWARAQPPLLDRWTGRLTTGNGDRLDLVLVLRRADPGGDGTICENCNQIEGSATTADSRGKTLGYQIFGSPRDRQGHQLQFGAKSDQRPPPDGLELDWLRGTWDGADTLTLEAGFFWRRGVAAISSTDDPATKPVPLVMRRSPLVP